VRVTGSIGDSRLDGVLGHGARLEGVRRPERFGWAHAVADDGRFVELLAGEVPGLPRVGLWATESAVHNGTLELLRSRPVLEPTRLCVGPFTVEADAADLVGVTYRDPDGRELYCYHAERGRLRGPSFAAEDAAFEFATREKVPGWPISL